MDNETRRDSGKMLFSKGVIGEHFHIAGGFHLVLQDQLSASVVPTINSFGVSRWIVLFGVT